MLLDGHHNKIIYEDITMDKKDLYSWKLKKPGLNTQFIIDINKIVVFVSDSLSCRYNNDDKMLINNINFNNFTFPIEKKKDIELTNDEDVSNIMLNVYILI